MAYRRMRRRPFHRKRSCRLCADPSLKIDYKDTRTLASFLTDRGKIIPRRISNNCAKCQRKLTLAIKRARQLALLPYTVHHTV